jgi:hypothetical protein
MEIIKDLDRLQRYLAHGHLGAAADGFKSAAHV